MRVNNNNSSLGNATTSGGGQNPVGAITATPAGANRAAANSLIAASLHSDTTSPQPGGAPGALSLMSPLAVGKLPPNHQ